MLIKLAGMQRKRLISGATANGSPISLSLQNEVTHKGVVMSSVLPPRTKMKPRLRDLSLCQIDKRPFRLMKGESTPRRKQLTLALNVTAAAEIHTDRSGMPVESLPDSNFPRSAK